MQVPIYFSADRSLQIIFGGLRDVTRMEFKVINDITIAKFQSFSPIHLCEQAFSRHIENEKWE